MSNLFEKYEAKNVMTASSSDFTDKVTVNATKDIIKNVFLGGNVRDTTEFITQSRLLLSYAAMLNIMAEEFDNDTNSYEYIKRLLEDLKQAKTQEQMFYLWLLGLTKKGLDNIVRGINNIESYSEEFYQSIQDVAKNLKDKYGNIDGNITINGNTLPINWETIAFLFIATGSQTLTIRGSAKSMNGKMFEKLVLGSLLTIMGFQFCTVPPHTFSQNDKLFWLSHMDEHERETDATLVYNCKAISIDIGFIGKGNPEITLDKVTRFGAYKTIGTINHSMSTVIIVDTVGSGSDLFNKAKAVNGHVIQMNDPDWIIHFATLLGEIFGITHPLQKIERSNLKDYLKKEMENIDISSFLVKK